MHVVCVSYYKLYSLVELALRLTGFNVIMTSRKYGTLQEDTDLLLGESNVCGEQAVVSLPPEQENGYATLLELGENDNHSLKRFHNDAAGWVKVCGDSTGKGYVAYEASYSVGFQLKRKNENPPQSLQTGNMAQT